MFQSFQKLALLLLSCLALTVFADDTTEGWAWGITCPGDGGGFPGGGVFSATTSSGFIGSGACNRTSTHFTQFAFTSTSGATTTTSTLYALHTGDWLVIPPTLSTETQPVYTVAPACPVLNKTLNWIFVQWDTGTRTMSNTYVIGTASYDTVAGITVTDQYDVTGAVYWPYPVPMPGSCSSGIYTITGQTTSELDGSVFLTLDGSGVYKTTLGHATFFMPQYAVTPGTDLANLSTQAMSFDSYNASDTRNAVVSTDSTGYFFTVQPYLDPGAGTVDSTYVDTITISQANSPQNGMLIGSITRSTGGAGSIACIVDRSVDTRVICAGQSPSNPLYPYTVTFVVEGANVLGQQTTMSSAATAQGFSVLGHINYDGTRFFVGDDGNSRILIYNSLPTADTPANVVIGQPSFNVSAGNSTGISAQTLSSAGFQGNPVFSDSTRLYVSDGGNNRVLIWSQIPTVSSTPADIVLGQPDMTSNAANNGGLGASTFSNPKDVLLSGGILYVADYNNNRILAWNSIPTVNGQPANFVIGQPNLTSNTLGTTASTMYQPMGLASDGTRLFTTEWSNQRILVWNTLPTATQPTANIVLGQPNFTSNSVNYGTSFGAYTSSSNIDFPKSLATNGTALIVTTSANTVEIWNTITGAQDQPANVLLGQTAWGSGTCLLSCASGGAGPQPNHDGSPYYQDDALGFYFPDGLVLAGSSLYVADTNNNRIVIYNTIPTATYTAANLVIGQGGSFANYGAGGPIGAAATNFHTARDVATCGTNLFVVDENANRVLIWNSLPTSDQQPANVVLGQPNLTTSTANTGGESSSSLSNPFAVYCDGTKVYVTDYGNERVLIWNTIPTANQTPANVAVGQLLFTTAATGKTATNLNAPQAAYSDGTNLYVADSNNNRVLIWTAIPTTNGAAATYVLGQSLMTKNTSGVSVTNMHNPVSVRGDGTRLFVGDWSNNRVLIWNTPPTAGPNTPANIALGQPNLNSSTANNGGVSSSSMSGPEFAYSNGTSLWVADQENNRVLFWPAIPTTQTEANIAASYAYGQPNLTSNASNNGVLSSGTLAGVIGIYSDGTRLFIADTNNSRVLILPLP